jgi:hypothetical protein
MLTVIFSLFVFLTRDTPFIQESFQTAVATATASASATITDSISSLTPYCDVSGVCRYAKRETDTSILIYQATGNGNCDSGFTYNADTGMCVSNTCPSGFTMDAGKCTQTSTGSNGSTSSAIMSPPSVVPKCSADEDYNLTLKKCAKKIGRVSDCMLDYFSLIDKLIAEPTKDGKIKLDNQIKDEYETIMKCYTASRSDLNKIYGTDTTLLFRYYLSKGIYYMDNPCCKQPMSNTVKYGLIGGGVVGGLVLLKIVFS